LGFVAAGIPSVETLGYFRMSLRDTAELVLRDAAGEYVRVRAG